MRLVLASNNAKKLVELRTLLAALPMEWVSAGELCIAEPPEPHLTFIENALAKARHAALQSGAAAIADDSGLCVAALGGAPGVASAHFATVALPDTAREAQRRVQDEANNALLLERLRGRPDRRAHFICTLVAVRSANDPEPLVAIGRWRGDILDSPRGDRGFGYDPLMYIAQLGATVAELDASTKNEHSHRALAARQMLTLMRENWHLA
jgi:XTP/dITP diphosphohydrolase